MRACFLIIVFTISICRAKPPATYLYPIIWQWFIGKADSVYYFNQNTHETIISNLKNAWQVRRAKEFWYAKNLDSFKNGHYNWLPMTGFSGRFHDIQGFAHAGFDMVEQSLGGFTVHIKPVGRDSIKYTVYDLKSRWSFFLHFPLVKNRVFDPQRRRQKMMSNVKWFFEWTEPINKQLFYRRELNIRLKGSLKYTGKGY